MGQLHRHRGQLHQRPVQLLALLLVQLPALLSHGRARRLTASATGSLPAYWLVNGSGQAEDFNGPKSQHFTFTWKPAGAVSWTGNYYTGIESPDAAPLAGPSTVPVQAGLPPPRSGPRLTDAPTSWIPTRPGPGPADHAGRRGRLFIRRVRANAAPARVTIGAVYLRRRAGAELVGGRAGRVPLRPRRRLQRRDPGSKGNHPDRGLPRPPGFCCAGSGGATSPTSRYFLALRAGSAEDRNRHAPPWA